jgi:hypothetical protein
MNMITVDQETLKRMIMQVAEAEREACAKVCDNFEISRKIEGAHPDYLVGKEMAATQLAHAIRARGNK